MISLEDAKKIAEEWLGRIGGCTEYAGAYVFFSANSEYSDGGPGSPVVVLKENGARCGLPDFISHHDGGEKIREISF